LSLFMSSLAIMDSYETVTVTVPICVFKAK